MNCRDVEAKVTAYLDGELDATTSSALRGHLRTCAACRALAEDHARIAGALASLTPAEPGPAMWNGVLARLAEAEATDAKRSGVVLWLRGTFEKLRAQVVPLTAIAAAAVVAIVWFARQQASTLSVNPELAIQHAPPAVVVVKDAPSITVGAEDPRRGPSPREDVEAAIARETARVDRIYAKTAAELLEDAADERATWAPPRQRVFDAELARLQAHVIATEAPPPVAQLDAFDRAEALTAAREARERAWQRLIRFLQDAALGGMVAEVTP